MKEKIMPDITRNENQNNQIENNPQVATILSCNQFLKCSFGKSFVAKMSDFAIIQGGFSKIKETRKHFFGKKQKTRKGAFYLSNLFHKDLMPNNEAFYKKFGRLGVKPSLKVSSFFELLADGRSYIVDETETEAELVYGQYPQNVAPSDIQQLLNDFYNSGELEETGKTYTDAFGKKLIEYEFAGKYYVRAQIHNDDDDSIALSNDCLYTKDQYVWVTVEPLHWILDKKNNTMITRDIVLAGLIYEFDADKDNNALIYKNSSFINEALPFVNNHFIQECIQESTQELTNDVVENEQEIVESSFTNTDIINEKGVQNNVSINIELSELLEQKKALQGTLDSLKQQIKEAKDLINSFINKGNTDIDR